MIAKIIINIKFAIVMIINNTFTIAIVNVIIENHISHNLFTAIIVIIIMIILIITQNQLHQ